jgi:hypothetical protein
MNMDSSKLLAIETFSVFSVLPHIPLGLLAPARNQFPLYGLAVSTFSLGLPFPESWLKRRIASGLRVRRGFFI